jgi:hypothetical protein
MEGYESVDALIRGGTPLRPPKGGGGGGWWGGGGGGVGVPPPYDGFRVWLEGGWWGPAPLRRIPCVVGEWVVGFRPPTTDSVCVG